jgi:hypothetical protein
MPVAGLLQVGRTALTRWSAFLWACITRKQTATRAAVTNVEPFTPQRTVDLEAGRRKAVGYATTHLAGSAQHQHTLVNGRHCEWTVRRYLDLPIQDQRRVIIGIRCFHIQYRQVHSLWQAERSPGWPARITVAAVRAVVDWAAVTRKPFDPGGLLRAVAPRGLEEPAAGLGVVGWVEGGTGS